MDRQAQDTQKIDYDVWISPEGDRVTIIRHEPDTVDSVPVSTITEEPLRFILPVFFISHLLIALTTIAYVLYLCIPSNAQVTIYLDHIPSSLIQVHLLPSISISQSATVKSTGHIHVQATQAHGLVYLYNSLTQEQTIQQGMLLIGSDGQQIVTDESVTIPAGNLNVYGKAAVLAHALSYGSAGNINSGDISSPCLKPFLQCVNGAFSGGQDARDYATVTKADIYHAVQSATTLVQHSLQGRMASLPLPHGEVMLSPVSCSSSTVANHTPGDVVQQVTVAAHQLCKPQVYSLNDLKRTLVSLIKGQTPNAARAILARYGIYSIGIKLGFLQERLPQDIRKIQLSLLLQINHQFY